jgi:hypothetical protein
MYFRGVSGGWAGWAIALPVLGRIEGAAGQRRRAVLLLAHPVFGSHYAPVFRNVLKILNIMSLVAHGFGYVKFRILNMCLF